MNSEYNTSYNTKAENTTLNHAVVHVAAALANKDKTPAQVKSNVLAKMMNSITKTIAYPLVMSASYLLGNGDSWFPMRVERHDFYLFQRHVLGKSTAFEELDVEHTFVAEEADDMSTPAVIRALDAVTWYIHRCEALKQWSSVEVAIGFKRDDADTKAAKQFLLISPYTSKAHKPRYDKFKDPSPIIPQGIKEHPIKPTADAPFEMKEHYASSWVFNRQLRATVTASDEPGIRDMCDDDVDEWVSGISYAVI
jgi:hypothetical protein